MMEVDEIHIFDTTGRIYAGTHPEYYDYTFDSGEQMNFFKPLLTDKSLHLVQDITPNTAEAKMMQYSALWSKSGEIIGSTDLPSVGRHLSDIGLDPDAISTGTTAFHAKINGVSSYCVFRLRIVSDVYHCAPQQSR